MVLCGNDFCTCAYLYGWLIKILQDTAGNNFEVVKNRIKNEKTTERKSKKTSNENKQTQF